MANPALESARGRFSNSYLPHQGQALTIDSVVQKTRATVGILVLTALATWWGIANALSDESTDTFSLIMSGAFFASIAAVGLSFVISFKQKVNVPLILAFSALEGVAIGAMSKVVALQTGSLEPVMGAILGTFVAVAATLGVYKYTGLRTTDKMRRFVTIAMFAFVGVSLIDLVLHFFGAAVGVNGFGGVGAIFSVVGVIIALFMLYMDFEVVEDSVAAGVPDKEGWRIAFGLTVTLVWIYVNLLKILAYLRGSD